MRWPDLFPWQHAWRWCAVPYRPVCAYAHASKSITWWQSILLCRVQAQLLSVHIERFGFRFCYLNESQQFYSACFWHNGGYRMRFGHPLLSCQSDSSMYRFILTNACGQTGEEVLSYNNLSSVPTLPPTPFQVTSAESQQNTSTSNLNAPLVLPIWAAAALNVA